MGGPDSAAEEEEDEEERVYGSVAVVKEEMNEGRVSGVS